MKKISGPEKIGLKRMSLSHTNESLLHVHPEGAEEDVDKEWDEFQRVMEKFKERRNRSK